MEPHDGNRLSQALRRRAARNRREAGLPPERDDPLPLTLHDLAELMAAEFDVTRSNQDRIEETLARAVDVQAQIIAELTDIRALLQTLVSDPAAPDGQARLKDSDTHWTAAPKAPNAP